MRAVGMRTKVEEGRMVVNTCSGNDTTVAGDLTHWTWANPTNRALPIGYAGVQAASVEALWQGTKVLPGREGPNFEALNGNWRLGKGKKPIGAWAGEGQPLITDPGEARRKIYIPAYKRQIEWWRTNNPQVEVWIQTAMEEDAILRDYDTGQGIDRRGPMSHAWLLIEILEGRV